MLIIHNTLVNGETGYHTVKVSANMQTEVDMKVSGETGNLMVKELRPI